MIKRYKYDEGHKSVHWPCIFRVGDLVKANTNARFCGVVVAVYDIAPAQREFGCRSSGGDYWSPEWHVSVMAVDRNFAHTIMVFEQVELDAMNEDGELVT